MRNITELNIPRTPEIHQYKTVSARLRHIKSRTMKKRLTICTLLIIAVMGVTHLLINSRDIQLFGKVVDRIETSQKIVALTFDEAPVSPNGDTGNGDASAPQADNAELTPQNADAVLTLLQVHRIPATFYTTGSSIQEHPDVARRIAASGHELGNHSFSNRRMVFKSQKFIQKEIQDTNRLIRQSGWKGDITFRPPYGKKLIGLPWYLKQQGITTVLWDVDPELVQVRRKNTETMAKYALDRVRPGSIIILRPFCDKKCAPSRAALPAIIAGLKARGYRFVTVSELLRQNPA